MMLHRNIRQASQRGVGIQQVRLETEKGRLGGAIDRRGEMFYGDIGTNSLYTMTQAFSIPPSMPVAPALTVPSEVEGLEVAVPGFKQRVASYEYSTS